MIKEKQTSKTMSVIKRMKSELNDLLPDHKFMILATSVHGNTAVVTGSEPMFKPEAQALIDNFYNTGIKKDVP